MISFILKSGFSPIFISRILPIYLIKISLVAGFILLFDYSGIMFTRDCFLQVGLVSDYDLLALDSISGIQNSILTMKDWVLIHLFLLYYPQNRIWQADLFSFPLLFVRIAYFACELGISLSCYDVYLGCLKLVRCWTDDRILYQEDDWHGIIYPIISWILDIWSTIFSYIECLYKSKWIRGSLDAFEDYLDWMHFSAGLRF